MRNTTFTWQSGMAYRRLYGIISYILIESVVQPDIHPKAPVSQSVLPRGIQMTEGLMLTERKSFKTSAF